LLHSINTLHHSHKNQLVNGMMGNKSLPWDP